jgi:SAM-dependent methyltransferase
MESIMQKNKRTFWDKIYSRLFRGFIFSKKKLSTRNLDRLCREYASTKKSLIIHSEDVDYRPYFPNAYTVTKRADHNPDLICDLYYTDLCKIPDESYEIVVCTGLLEHIPQPSDLIADLHRILTPGGKLVISASAVFSFHECPDNFFHFTPYGFRLLFKDWGHFEMLRGASQPFETIGILLQRILMQCEVNPIARFPVEVLSRSIRFLDFFIVRQFDTVKFSNKQSQTDSMLPSNIQACVVKAAK